ncbi:hypothetical protein P8452_36479 [Trifolium repens]|nr:hypothetical protein P8452_36479 [Trifolium repens]
MDDPTKEQQRLDYARVQVLINGWEPIDKMVDIRVGNDLFVLRVVEEQRSVEVKNNEGALGSTNCLESNESIGSPDRRWVVDDDGLHGDWTGGSVPERPLRLNLNVTGFGPLDNNIQQQLMSDTPNIVPVEACLGVEEGDFQIKSRVPLNQTPTKGMEKGVVVVPDMTIEEEGVEAAVSEGYSGTGQSQQCLGMTKEVGVVGGVEENMRKEDDMGRIPFGPSGLEKDKAEKGVVLEGVEGQLLKGSCSGWAQTNKFGPLLAIQQEGGVVLRDSDADVARLAILEETNTDGLTVCGVTKGSKHKGRRKGGLYSKKKNKSSHKQGAPKCVRFADAVKNARRPKHDSGGNSLAQTSDEVSQSSDPIQTPSFLAAREVTVCAPVLSDMNSFNNESLVDGIMRCENQVDPVNFRIEAERLFNIGMNLGISSNEDRISMVERLIDSEGADDLVGDVEVDR